VLLSRSAATLPQEIVEPWMVPSLGPGGVDQLPEGSVRLAPMDFGAFPAVPERRHPRHLVIEGVVAGNGAANGVYRIASELNQKPVYHKTDAVRTASLWYAGGDWRIGPSIEDGKVWAYATVESPSSDARWFSFAGVAEKEIRVVDAAVAIPNSLSISGTPFVQDSRLCDARPVYAAESSGGEQKAQHVVYLYFRAHESEWWLGPEVGGKECLARASGSLLSVIPEPKMLQWRTDLVPSPPEEDWSGADAGDPDIKPDEMQSLRLRSPSWFPFVCSLVTALLGVAVWLRGSSTLGYEGKAGVQKKIRKGSEKPEALACVVCLEAPRKILLMPCRHVCCCKDCAERLERCPMCRTETTSLAEVFL